MVRYDTTRTMSESNNFRCARCGKEREPYRVRKVRDEIVCDFCLLDEAASGSLAPSMVSQGFPLTPLLAVKLVTPQDWERILRNRFVLGYVLTAAFEACPCIRIRRDGIVFEVDQLSDAELEALGNKLDRAADAAFALRQSLDRLEALGNRLDRAAKSAFELRQSLDGLGVFFADRT